MQHHTLCSKCNNGDVTITRNKPKKVNKIIPSYTIPFKVSFHNYFTNFINQYSSILFPPVIENDTKSFASPSPPAPEKIKEVSTTINISFEPLYRIIIVYTNWSDDKLIAEKVKSGVPIISYKEAIRAVKYAKSHGKAILCVVLKDKAILYSKKLNLHGISVILEEA